MESKAKYLEVVERINLRIAVFNSLLSENHQVELLDIEKLNDEGYFLGLNNKEWGDYDFPRNRVVGGVYFYFGCALDNPDNLCLYIGKASYSRTTGQRLWNHFRYMKQGAEHDLKYYIKDGYKIEMITSVPFEKENTVCLAAALEEFLILSLKIENVELLNRIGNG